MVPNVAIRSMLEGCPPQENELSQEIALSTNVARSPAMSRNTCSISTLIISEAASTNIRNIVQQARLQIPFVSVAASLPVLPNEILSIHTSEEASAIRADR